MTRREIRKLCQLYEDTVLSGSGDSAYIVRRFKPGLIAWNILHEHGYLIFLN